MIRDHLLSVVLLAPFAGAVALLAIPQRARLAIRLAAVGSALPPLLVSMVLAWLYDESRGGFQMVETAELLPAVGISYRLGVDGVSVPLVVLTAVIYFAAIFTSWTILERDKEFFLYLALLVTGVFGVFVSLDLFLFFLFYELAVLPMYLLIGIWGSTKEIPGRGPMGWTYRAVRVGFKEYGAMKLTLYLLAGSALILLGLFVLYVEAGRLLPEATFDYAALASVSYPQRLARTLFLLFYLGFGVLAGIWPLHTWSPDGHAAAPAAGSMMHAGVLMKLGAYGVLRLGFGLFPEAAAELSWLVGAVAAINIVYGAFAAAWQSDVKYLIAYSSVSHMGIVMLGMATRTEPGLAGSVFQMVSHGIMTGLLFTVVNLLYAKTHTRDMFQMGGLAARMPGLTTFLVLGALTSLGLPGLSGFVAEFLVFFGTWVSESPWWLFPAVAGTLVTAVYVLRAVKVICFGPPLPQHAGVEDARATEWVSLVVLGGLLVLLGAFPRLLLDTIGAGVADLLERLGG